LLREAEQLAAGLGMSELASEISQKLRGNEAGDFYPDGLTTREVDVLKLIAIGRSNKDIALVLSISLNTVATHVRNILTKTECANRTEAAAYASRNGLVETH
jgi:DNA-binding NarL/FixJ family response regulator